MPPFWAPTAASARAAALARAIRLPLGGRPTDREYGSTGKNATSYRCGRVAPPVHQVVSGLAVVRELAQCRQRGD